MSIGQSTVVTVLLSSFLPLKIFGVWSGWFVTLDHSALL